MKKFLIFSFALVFSMNERKIAFVKKTCGKCGYFDFFPKNVYLPDTSQFLCEEIEIKTCSRCGISFETDCSDFLFKQINCPLAGGKGHTYECDVCAKYDFHSRIYVGIPKLKRSLNRQLSRVRRLVIEKDDDDAYQRKILSTANASEKNLDEYLKFISSVQRERPFRKSNQEKAEEVENQLNIHKGICEDNLEILSAMK